MIPLSLVVFYGFLSLRSKLITLFIASHMRDGGKFSVHHVRSHMSVYLIVIRKERKARTRFNRLMIPYNTCDVFLIALRNVNR